LIIDQETTKNRAVPPQLLFVQTWMPVVSQVLRVFSDDLRTLPGIEVKQTLSINADTIGKLRRSIS
jgi:hypothetical protein